MYRKEGETPKRTQEAVALTSYFLRRASCISSTPTSSSFDQDLLLSRTCILHLIYTYEVVASTKPLLPRTCILRPTYTAQRCVAYSSTLVHLHTYTERHIDTVQYHGAADKHDN
jgi:hypothetical protein